MGERYITAIKDETDSVKIWELLAAKFDRDTMSNIIKLLLQAVCPKKEHNQSMDAYVQKALDAKNRLVQLQFKTAAGEDINISIPDPVISLLLVRNLVENHDNKNDPYKTLYDTLEILTETGWAWNATGAGIANEWRAQQ
ncbi:MAG: hypothetical protein L3J05_09860 [Robiginitomaculum sp.]|nr:hypothetical protein [Robiginitomaculum sp.]